jgi:hypothetical protein
MKELSFTEWGTLLEIVRLNRVINWGTGEGIKWYIVSKEEVEGCDD